jgi:hypothetical protein
MTDVIILAVMIIVCIVVFDIVIVSLAIRVIKLESLIRNIYAFMTRTDFNFKNGNTDPSGTADEGEYYGTKAMSELFSDIQRIMGNRLEKK